MKSKRTCSCSHKKKSHTRTHVKKSHKKVSKRRGGSRGNIANFFHSTSKQRRGKLIEAAKIIPEDFSMPFIGQRTSTRR